MIISVFPLDKVKKIRYNNTKGNDGKEYAVPQSPREPVLVEAGTTQPQKILPEPYSEISPESSLYRNPTVTAETYHVCEWYNRIFLSRTFPGFFVFRTFR